MIESMQKKCEEHTSTYLDTQTTRNLTIAQMFENQYLWPPRSFGWKNKSEETL